MPDYIDRESLLSLETVMVDPDGFEHSCVLSVDVRRAKAADVAPVRHAKWEIVAGSNGKEYMVCTECRKQQDLAGVFSYCPNCGAKMGEEDKNHDADE